MVISATACLGTPSARPTLSHTGIGTAAVIFPTATTQAYCKPSPIVSPTACQMKFWHTWTKNYACSHQKNKTLSDASGLMIGWMPAMAPVCCGYRKQHTGAMAGARYDLIAWVVMPNHVHVLIRTYEGVTLGKIVQSWKSYTGRQISKMQTAQETRLGNQDSAGIWMREYWDRFIRDEPHFQTVIAYIHQNPVKAGLVAHAEDWFWSSAAELALGVPREGQ